MVVMTSGEIVGAVWIGSFNRKSLGVVCLVTFDTIDSDLHCLALVCLFDGSIIDRLASVSNDLNA